MAKTWATKLHQESKSEKTHSIIHDNSGYNQGHSCKVKIGEQEAKAPRKKNKGTQKMDPSNRCNSKTQNQYEETNKLIKT